MKADFTNKSECTQITTENTEEIAEMVNAEDAVEKTEATENTETEKEIEIIEDDNISAEQIKESDNEKS